MLKKGQISIELLIVVLFLISFIYVYNNLAEQTVYSLELTKIKEQQQDIALSLNEFLQFQRNVLNYHNQEIITYQSTFKIPRIDLASKRMPCKINLSENGILVDVNYNWVTSYALTVSYPEAKYALPETVNCGQEIICTLNSNKIVCN